MFTKKRGLMLLAAILLTVCAIWEYAMPTDAAVKSYYLKVEATGKPVQKNQFKGFKYNAKVYDDKGKQKQLTFYSEKELTKNDQFKVLIGENKMVVNYKKIKNVPDTMKYLAEQ
ncbi:YxeA family protein [Listeria swaminathanii]|uniref:YxeA family protein n=2 Tax=Listeria TaxID=1637 RepID=A0A7X1DNN1_9LIST|nr:YxeA family protein [Listeria swaminathanii]MCD2248983.1 YxeA family protein [Listeria marthii]MBC2330178.1 YxeA family protein [Listeria swaminathanii]MDT0018148.1 YxeA family protein [Listeria swaminathanii]MDT0022543.1 YxeA family protein [Listeria swaminathanii]MDT0033507.1 YxeA family protein [Listeria swaminathanii]